MTSDSDTPLQRVDWSKRHCAADQSPSVATSSSTTTKLSFTSCPFVLRKHFKNTRHNSYNRPNKHESITAVLSDSENGSTLPTATDRFRDKNNCLTSTNNPAATTDLNLQQQKIDYQFMSPDKNANVSPPSPTNAQQTLTLGNATSHCDRDADYNLTDSQTQPVPVTSRDYGVTFITSPIHVDQQQQHQYNVDIMTSLANSSQSTVNSRLFSSSRSKSVVDANGVSLSRV